MSHWLKLTTIAKHSLPSVAKMVEQEDPELTPTMGTPKLQFTEQLHTRMTGRLAEKTSRTKCIKE